MTGVSFDSFHNTRHRRSSCGAIASAILTSTASIGIVSLFSFPLLQAVERKDEGIDGQGRQQSSSQHLALRGIGKEISPHYIVRQCQLIAKTWIRLAKASSDVVQRILMRTVRDTLGITETSNSRNDPKIRSRPNTSNLNLSKYEDENNSAGDGIVRVHGSCLCDEVRFFVSSNEKPVFENLTRLSAHFSPVSIILVFSSIDYIPQSTFAGRRGKFFVPKYIVSQSECNFTSHIHVPVHLTMTEVD